MYRPAASHLAARRPWVFTLLGSLAGVAVSGVWLVNPATNPYGPGDAVTVGINHLIEPDVLAVMLLAFAGLGILLAGIALRGEVTGTGLRVAYGGAALEAAFFAFVMADAAVISTLGYAVALGAPIGVVTLLVLIGRRWRRAGVAMAALGLVLGTAGLATGALRDVADPVATYLGNLSEGLSTYGPRIAWSWGMAIAAAGWAWATLRSLSHRSSWARPQSVMKWGRVVTIGAALGPVPYGLLRLTWLTPWPLGGPDGFVISGGMDTATRLQGSLFAPACAVGVVLTLGLISRWGETFPRWIAVLGGRAVPIKLAVIPGAIVAGIITISAPGVLVGPIESGDPGEIAGWLLFFPFPVWGPLLGAAVLSYWLRRTARGGYQVRGHVSAHGQSRHAPRAAASAT